jgi:hypothetical protein
VGSKHSWQMRRTAGTGDQYAESLFFCLFCEVGKQIGRSMRGNYPALMLDFEFPQQICSMPHRCPVGFTSHDDRYPHSIWHSENKATRQPERKRILLETNVLLSS